MVADINIYGKIDSWQNTSMVNHLAFNKHSITVESLVDIIEKNDAGKKKQKAQCTLLAAISGKKSVPLKLKQDH